MKKGKNVVFKNSAAFELHPISSTMLLHCEAEHLEPKMIFILNEHTIPISSILSEFSVMKHSYVMSKISTVPFGVQCVLTLRFQ